MTSGRHDVFISYSSRDKLVADAVCAKLERNGIRCWIAPRDVLAGDDWPQAIVQAISGARVFVLLFSASSNTSAQIRREVERAANREIPIIPFRLEDIPPNQSLEYFISSPHWMDALTAPVSDHIERLSSTIQQLLARKDTPSAVAQGDLAAARVDPPRAPDPATPTSPPAGAAKRWAFIAGGALAVLLIGALALKVAAPAPKSPQPGPIAAAQASDAPPIAGATPAAVVTTPAPAAVAAPTVARPVEDSQQTTPTPSAAPRDDPVRYAGVASCHGEGSTSMSLAVPRAVGGGEQTVVVRLGPTPSSPNVPNQTFEMAGHVDIDGGPFELRPLRWIHKPDGNYSMAPLSGDAVAGGDALDGQILLAGCGAFHLSRVR